MIDIGLWDNDHARIQRGAATLEAVLRRMHLRGRITYNCEPPQLSRQNLEGRYPSLEINNEFWCRTPGEDLKAEHLEELFRMLIKSGRLQASDSRSAR